MFATVARRAALGGRNALLGTTACCRGAPQQAAAACCWLASSSFHSSALRSMPEKTSQPPTDDPAIQQLIRDNRAWVESKSKDPEYFAALGRGQAPEFLYIGCSDSRVAISSLTGLDLGHVFVHRNIANMVVSADLNLLSVLTYAVEHLKVQHILVTGHYDCGGIRAAVKKQDYGQVLDAWLQNIRDVYRLHKDELDAIADEEARHRRLVELNVAEQCLNLYKTAVVQKRRLETYRDPDAPQTLPRVHGLVFDPATGILNKVPIDYRRDITELRSTYDLFDIDHEINSTAEYVLPKDTTK